MSQCTFALSDVIVTMSLTTVVYISMRSLRVLAVKPNLPSCNSIIARFSDKQVW